MDLQENHTEDVYKTLSSPSKGIYKDKGSKFLSFAFPVSDIEEIKTELDRLRKEYYDARHHCYAYRLGHTGDIWRANDDGEPSSTAGKQILGQLLSKELCNVLVVVVRYFGGIKLGIPGLIKAYRTATLDAIANGEIIEKTATARIATTFSYENTHSITRALKEMNVTPKKFISKEDCTIITEIGLSETDSFMERISEAGGSPVIITEEQETN